MGTKDRERARKRRAIERAQRAEDAERGEDRGASQPPDKQRDDTAKRGDRDRDRRAAQPASPFAAKGKAGDRDHRGRLRTRDQIVHPRISFFVLLGAFLLALPGLLNARLQVLTWVAYTFAFVALADLARTKVQSFICLAGAAFAFTLLIGQISLMVAG